MKLNNGSNESILRRSRGAEHGQSIALVMIGIVGILAMAGFVIDVGRVYFGYQQLQAATQAAALAGGAALSAAPASDSQSQATSYVEGIAKTYSAVPSIGNLNATSALLQNVTISYAPKCLNTLTSAGILCTASAASANALQVTETAQVPTTFARVLGISTWTISATATASAKNGSSSPYNVAIILDTTSSMNDTDTDSQCDTSRISCALSGLQILLGSLYPCAGGLASCGSTTETTPTVYGVEGSGSPPYTATYSQGTESATNVAAASATFPVDKVSLFVFPGLASTSDASKDYTGSCAMPSGDIVAYNSGPVYQVVPFSSDYRTSGAYPADCSPASSTFPACALNTSSNLVIAAGGGSSCRGVSAPGGEGTFYAGAIDTAQANLVANAKPGTQNVIVLLSDGAANAGQTSSHMAGSKTAYPSGSTGGDCMQAVKSAQAAAMAGTAIYTVAYGAEAGASNCPTDNSPTMTPCETMEDMALQPDSTTPYAGNFFSDYTASSNGSTTDSSCISSAHPSSTLTEIFKELSTNFTLSRLIPNSTN